MFSPNSKKPDEAVLHNFFAWSPMTAEQQKRKLNLAVSAITHSLSLPAEQRADVRSAYVIAEDLGLRQAEIEYQMPFTRHVVFADVPFDALAVKGKTIFCAEVEFLTVPEFSPERLTAVFDKADYAKQRVNQLHPEMKFVLVLILITQLQPQDETNFHLLLEKQIRANAPVEVDAPIFNFERLQNTFVNE